MTLEDGDALTLERCLQYLRQARYYDVVYYLLAETMVRAAHDAGWKQGYAHGKEDFAE